MKLLAVTLCALALAAAGCGDDSSSTSDPSDFAATLDDLCTEQAAFNVSLPKKQYDEKLTSEEVQKLADEKGEEFTRRVEDLSTPDDLADEKQDLLDQLQQLESDPPTDPAEFKSTIATTSDLYRSLGADRCADYGEASVKVLDGASVEEAYRGLPLPGVPLD